MAQGSTRKSEKRGDRYINRELSWLEFNARVLALAEDPKTPLLERVKFLAIFSSNLDEFFQVRVAGLKDQVAAGVRKRTPDGRTPTEQLELITERAAELTERADGLFLGPVCTDLASAGVRFSTWAQLDEDDREWLADEFDRRIFPVLTPLAVDPGHPFPYISSLSLNLGVMVRDPVTEERRFARIKVPPLLPRFVVMPDGERFVPVEQVIAAHTSELFPGMEVEDSVAFRVTRNADLTVEEEEADDLLEAIELELRRRRFGKAVRLEVEDDISSEALELIRDELELEDEDVFAHEAPIALDGLWSVYALDRDDLKFTPFQPVTQRRLHPDEDDSERNIFSVISDGDLLVHHPYDSFDSSVEEFIRQAGRDPHVLTIKLTLYRTSGDSPIIAALIKAAERGKQVVALVELKARFDEQNNIEWARRLERSGVHVVYGLVGLKTHTKTCLVVREEGDGVRVDLIVRGICCLRPGVEGLSENITVRSIVGRYLEHSRIYRFANGAGAGRPVHYIGSADMMPRNLDRRVEAVVPIEDPGLQEQLDEVLTIELTDDQLAWQQQDRTWTKVPPATTGAGVDTHLQLEEEAIKRSEVEMR
jgi:polyphosphate kinase